jgi:UDP-3-O-[3-hydroxymyristoyl] glucosamine N-acyltransferase
MIYLKDIVERLSCDFEVIGSQTVGTGFCSIFEPITQGISWARAKDEGLVHLLTNNPVSIVFCHKVDRGLFYGLSQTLILVDNPQLAFSRMISFFLKEENIAPEIHPSAIISPRAIIGRDVSIGPFVEIGDCEIGDNVVINSHSKIHSRVKIGRNVLISEYCNIGGQGFGYIKNELNEFENQQHIGSVVIDDNVSIFPYSNVDRGTLGTTRIGKGTKIDHYCHIGHNTKIGENNLITPNVTTLGGVVIGNECMLGCGAQIRESVKIGNRVIIGMSSTVTKDVPDGETWLGSPAVEFSAFKRRSK